MIARRVFALLLLSALASLLFPACAVAPNHVTLFCEHDDAETTGGMRSTRTATNKVGASATYDLKSR